MRRFPCSSFLKRRRSAILLAIAGLLPAGCHPGAAPPKPTLQITQVPSTNPGGPVQMDYIAGRVDGAAPGQQIVLYAHSGLWWVQPFANQPLTKILPDSTWRNSTHLGTEYAAVLVEPGYRAVSKLVTLPAEGNGVVAIVTAKGEGAAPVAAKVIRFSGFD